MGRDLAVRWGGRSLPPPLSSTCNGNPAAACALSGSQAVIGRIMSRSWVAAGKRPAFTG
jgi:hypothetical protein